MFEQPVQGMSAHLYTHHLHLRLQPAVQFFCSKPLPLPYFSYLLHHLQYDLLVKKGSAFVLTLFIIGLPADTKQFAYFGKTL
jgi:hypothetical protein